MASFHYNELAIPVNYYIREVNFKSAGMRWNVDTITGEFSLHSGPAEGTIKGNFGMKLKESELSFSCCG